LEAIEYLRELAARVPHRGCGSPQERIAARWIAERLRAMGYTVAEQPFRTTRDNLYLMPAQVFALAIAGGWLALAGHRWPAAMLLAYSVAILLVEVSGRPLDVSLLPRFHSQNVYTQPAGQPPATIFVTAHYDSQRGSFLFHPRVLRSLPWFFRLCYLGLLLELLGVAAGGAWLRAGLAICIPAFAIFALAEISGRYTPGANDNGTGVALALYLAEDYARSPGDYPPGCWLRFLFTGCEEAGEKGMKAFLRAQRASLDPRRNRFVNLDNLGTGRLTCLAGEGLVWYRRAGATLLSAARSLPEAGERRNLLLPTDALPASALGYQAISFLGLEPNGHPGHYHYRTDTVDHVDPEFLRFQQAFFKEYLRRVMAAG
jgi:Peptidase family M28